jgi:hypothetical protein
MKYLSIFLLVILLYSCNENKKATSNLDQPFFQFDQIEYYHTPIAKDSLLAIEMKQDKSKKEQALLQILIGNVPVSIKDTLFIKNMEILNFKKYILDPKIYSKISHLFSFREASQPVVAKNNAKYLDVLIFRKNNNIIGMAKVSFEGLKHQMIGERYNDSKFGQSGEYKELENILSQYNK